jgi:hypothetical protein
MWMILLLASERFTACVNAKNDVTEEESNAGRPKRLPKLKEILMLVNPIDIREA